MPRRPSKADAVRALVTAFGESFAPNGPVGTYDVAFEGPAIRVTTKAGTRIERASEWKRLAGWLHAQTLPRKRADALGIVLPTLCEFSGSVWAPMKRLLEAPAVAEALAALEASLRDEDPDEALACRYSATFNQWAYSTPTFKTGRVRAAIDAAFAKHGALRAMPLVKLPLAFVRDPNPLERLRALAWVREAMSESPASLLGIHRLLVREILPLARTGRGLWREAAVSIVERWVRRLVVRGALPEALAMLEVLLDYGVGVPEHLALRYEALLGSDERDEADRAMARLRLIADPRGLLRVPLQRAEQHVDDVQAMALSNAAKALRQIADGAPPFTERRLKGEATPRVVTSAEAAKLARGCAEEAMAIFERRATAPPAIASPPNYAFWIERTKKVLASS